MICWRFGYFSFFYFEVIKMHVIFVFLILFEKGCKMIGAHSFHDLNGIFGCNEACSALFSTKHTIA